MDKVSGESVPGCEYYLIAREDKVPEVGDKIRVLGKTGFSGTMNAIMEDRSAWDKIFEDAQRPIIQQLRDAEEQYILDFFGGDIELAKRYAKDYYVEYSPLEMTEEDGKYSATQTMRMKRRMEIHP